jgi:hypothetical protein
MGVADYDPPFLKTKNMVTNRITLKNPYLQRNSIASFPLKSTIRNPDFRTCIN